MVLCYSRIIIVVRCYSHSLKLLKPHRGPCLLMGWPGRAPRPARNRVSQGIEHRKEHAHVTQFDTSYDRHDRYRPRREHLHLVGLDRRGAIVLALARPARTPARECAALPSPSGESLRNFIKRNGGMNRCASRYALGAASQRLMINVAISHELIAKQVGPKRARAAALACPLWRQQRT